MLLVGFGLLAVTVDASPEQIGPRWVGRIDADMPVHEAGGSAELAGVRGALADLTRRQAGIESRLTAAVELAALKDAPSLDDEVRALRLVAAALLLREGAQSARPFGPALDRFAAIAASVENADLEADLPPVVERITSLQPYAETGVISSPDLRRSFATLPDLIERAQPSGWWDSLLIMVGWRDDPLRPLHEAEVALMVGDLEGAVGSLAALQGEAALVAQGWLDLARARLSADALVDDLYQLALAAGSAPSAASSALASSDRGKPAPRRSFEPASWQAAQTTIGAGPHPR
jgi:hypothetical protein